MAGGGYENGLATLVPLVRWQQARVRTHPPTPPAPPPPCQSPCETAAACFPTATAPSAAPLPGPIRRLGLAPRAIGWCGGCAACSFVASRAGTTAPSPPPPRRLPRRMVQGGKGEVPARISDATLTDAEVALRPWGPGPSRGGRRACLGIQMCLR